MKKGKSRNKRKKTRSRLLWIAIAVDVYKRQDVEYEEGDLLLEKKKDYDQMYVLSNKFRNYGAACIACLLYTSENTLEDANNLMAKFRISGVPITEGRKLVGIITNRDLKFEEDFCH